MDKINEHEATFQIREWLEDNGYSVYTGNEFNVKNAAQKRPDMVVINNFTGSHSVIEIKRSRGKDINSSYKIMDYAFDYAHGAKYSIEGRNVELTNFLVATDESKYGKLFHNDIHNSSDVRERQAEHYETWGYGQVEPYCEYVKSFAFVRNLWRMWKKREDMTQLKIGILLSSINDKDKHLRNLLSPKIFVSRFNIKSKKGYITEKTMDKIIVKTDISEFRKFHNLLLKNAPGGYTPFYLKCEHSSKDPFLPAGKWSETELTFDNAVKWMGDGGNIGIAGLTEDPLVIVDIDDPSVTDYKTVKRTLTARSGSRTGFHLFYFEAMLGEIPNIPTDDAGELRANNQYVLAPGSFVRGYKDNLENIGKYTVEEATGASPISFSDIPRVFKDQLAKKKQDDSTARVRKAKKQDKYIDNSAFSSLSVHDILNDVRDPQKRFPSIFHTSKTGQNTSISEKGLLQCWRHNVSLNAQQALCVLSGFLTCQEAGTSHAGAGAGLSLYSNNDEALFHAWKYARENNYISEDDSIPGRVLRFIGIEQKFCTAADINDGWKMPRDAFKKANAYLEAEGLKKCSIALSSSVTTKTCQIENTGVREDLVKRISMKDVLSIDVDGKEQLDGEALLTYIEQENIYRGVVGTKDLKIYKDGVYQDVNGALDRFLQDCLGFKANIRLKSEINKQIFDRNPIEETEFDVETDLLPLQNGLLNIKTRSLKQFTPDKIFSSFLPVIFDKDAVAKCFLNALEDIVPKNEIPLVQEIFGYCLYRGYKTAKTFWFIGDGGNGKSALLTPLRALFGDHFSTIPLSQLDGNSRFTKVELWNSYINISTEPSTEKQFQTPDLKSLTGNDMVSGERKGVQGYKKFINFAKFFVVANALPVILDDSDGFWDRVIAVHFPFKIRGTKKEDADIFLKLVTPGELSGILNWALSGLARLRKNKWRFSTTEATRLEKGKMRLGSNPVAVFKESWLEFKPDSDMGIQTVGDAYELFTTVFDLEQAKHIWITKELKKDNRISKHRLRLENGARSRVLRGIELNSKIVCVYALSDGLFVSSFGSDEIRDETELKKCSLGEYLLISPEPGPEILRLVNNEEMIFRSEEVEELWNEQIKDGGKKVESGKTVEVASGSKQPPLFIKHISPLVEATCERCGNPSFLTHELTNEEGVKSLVCINCSKELEAEIGKLAPAVFGTTLDERRAKIKGEEKK